MPQCPVAYETTSRAQVPTGKFHDDTVTIDTRPDLSFPRPAELLAGPFVSLKVSGEAKATLSDNHNDLQMSDDGSVFRLIEGIRFLTKFDPLTDTCLTMAPLTKCCLEANFCTCM